MINNDLKRSLTEMYSEEGFVCPLCTEVFDQEDPKRKPIMLTCAQHNICRECFDEYKPKNLNTCPECRNIIVLNLPIVNSTVISAMDTAKKLFLRLNAAKTQSAPEQAAAPKLIPQVQPTLVPKDFETMTFCEYKWDSRNVSKEIEQIIPAVVKAMNWQAEEAELRSKFNSKKDEWILFLDTATNTPKGFTCLENPRDCEFVIHWTGITEQNQELYIDFYKHILRHVESKRRNTPNDWRDVSLSIILSSVNEHEFYRRIAGLLLARNMHFDSYRIVKNWGVQRKLTVYPCEGPYNQPKNELRLDETKELAFNVPYPNSIRNVMNRVLANDVHNLTAIFKLMTVNERYPESAIERLQSKFMMSPEDYFVYVIDEKAAGFIQFTRESLEQLSVVNCRLLPHQQQYANHFLEQFMHWALSKESMGKGLSAKQVRFSNFEDCPPVIQKAINRAMGI